ncbi:MAG TPA: hypothetical protein HA294_04165 [Nanoarchaeota archaeon]|nr:hypothetical protein [Candidatus Woesearchaeota archaeon]HIH59178.1 hypothetical protein [Nanoarchaeota archaeon]
MKLKKLDKSSQGFIDPDILPLLEIINKKYTTTSSCSGRITIIKGVKKGEVEWLYKTHTKASAVKIYNILQKEFSLRFFYEPLILHLQCKNQEEAEHILQHLQNNGFKKSYLRSFKHWTIEINDTGSMETIVTKDLSKEYISFLVKEANKRLNKTKENIKKLEKLFS